MSGRFAEGDDLLTALDLVDARGQAHDFGEVGGFKNTDLAVAAAKVLHVGKALVLIGVDIAESLRALVSVVENLRPR